MSDALYVEMPAEQKPLPFWKSRRGVAIAIFLLLILFAACFSWWLSRGKISSVAARLDTLVYTVEPEFSTQIRQLYVHPGDLVASGQPLALVEGTVINSGSANQAAEIDRLKQIPGMKAIAERLGEARKAERDMASRLAQARAEEDRYQRIKEARVTEHVRSQLAMRSINRHNIGAYEQASQAEQAARARMEAAKAEFEQVSRMRAAMDMELTRIRGEISKTRKRANLGDAVPGQKQENTPARPADEYLYAPVNGRILRVSGVPGQGVAQGEPLFYILPTARQENADVWIQAWFPLKDRDVLKVGQKVAVRFENMGLHLNGKVGAISHEAQTAPVQQNSTGSVNLNSVNAGEGARYNEDKYIPVRINLDDPALAAGIQPGAPADCQIQTRYFLGF